MPTCCTRPSANTPPSPSPNKLRTPSPNRANSPNNNNNLKFYKESLRSSKTVLRALHTGYKAMKAMGATKSVLNNRLRNIDSSNSILLGSEGKK
jgi:hypothetical protein